MTMEAAVRPASGAADTMSMYSYRRLALCLAGVAAITIPLLAGCSSQKDSAVAQGASSPAPPPVSTAEAVDKIKNNPSIPDSVKQRLITQLQDKQALKGSSKL
jgi:hypothetical protein